MGVYSYGAKMIVSGSTSKFYGFVEIEFAITSLDVGFSSITSYCSTLPNSVFISGILMVYRSSLTRVRLYHISPNLGCTNPIYAFARPGRRGR